MKKVVIIGAGLAGCFLAKQLKKKYDIHILTKGTLADSDSMLAQGGIACALEQSDSWQAHFADTMKSGKHHNVADQTQRLVQDGPEVLMNLISEGLSFDIDANGNLNYSLEGAHDRPRVLHIAGDQTGKYMTEFVQTQMDGVNIHENCFVKQVVKQDNRVVGVQYIDTQNQPAVLQADAVVLATGGIGGLYPMTSNDVTITGDGQAMALRAGAQLADMEFVQFHPTMLSVNGQCRGLISEAVRGAGGVLVDENFHQIMKDQHPLKDLAPRDVVARVIAHEYEFGHHVYLDISSVQNFERQFPQITRNLDQLKIPFRTTGLIPVQPGAHFMMGGIAVNSSGETTLPGLYAVGEVAYTGVHGANRLASNSLLECLVFGQHAANAIMNMANEDLKDIEPYVNNAKLILPTRKDLQARIGKAIGIEREPHKIQSFLKYLANFEFMDLPLKTTAEETEVANMCLVAQHIAQASLNRPTSLGAHYWKVNQDESIIS
ncbi:MAG: L-aspartate oxidase [Lactobacillaceae bacterium]|nr:L-aspartate oxidase [Lactobacillaceae bacterium]